MEVVVVAKMKHKSERVRKRAIWGCDDDEEKRETVPKGKEWRVGNDAIMIL